MSTTPARRLSSSLCLLIFLATLAVFWPARHFAFLDVDDGVFVTENPMVQQGLTLEGIQWAFTQFHASNWVPITFVSLMLDRSLFGPGPEGFHLTNLVLHALNAALLFLLAVRLTRRPATSALLALLFALHPMRVESVVWISERKDVLSTAFWLLTTLAWIRWVDGRRRIDLVWALLAYAFGLATKGMLVTLPLTLLILDWWPLRRRETPRRLVIEKFPLFALALAGALVTLAAQSGGTAVTGLQALGPDARVANAVVGYASYLIRLFWPMELSYFYPHPSFLPPYSGWSAFRVLSSALLLTGITGICTMLARRGVRPPLAGWLWYLVTLLPVIGLVQVGLQASADRYTYVPHIGILVALVACGVELARRRPAARRMLSGLAALLLGASALMTAREITYWRDSETLFTRAIEVTERNGVAMAALGGHYARSGRLAEARELLEEATRSQPRYAQAHAVLGIVLAALGDDRLAARELTQALEVLPDHARARVALGNVLAREGRPTDAARQFREALSIDPDLWEAHFGLGLIARLRGRTDAAFEHFERAEQRAPDEATRERIRAAMQ